MWKLILFGLSILIVVSIGAVAIAIYWHSRKKLWAWIDVLLDRVIEHIKIKGEANRAVTAARGRSSAAKQLRRAAGHDAQAAAANAAVGELKKAFVQKALNASQTDIEDSIQVGIRVDRARARLRNAVAGLLVTIRFLIVAALVVASVGAVVYVGYYYNRANTMPRRATVLVCSTQKVPGHSSTDPRVGTVITSWGRFWVSPGVYEDGQFSTSTGAMTTFQQGLWYRITYHGGAGFLWIHHHKTSRWITRAGVDAKLPPGKCTTSSSLTSKLKGGGPRGAGVSARTLPINLAVNRLVYI